MQNTNSRQLPTCGVISSFQSLRDALRGETIARLAQEFGEFLTTASQEEILFLSSALEVRNQCTDPDSDDFRICSAIEFVAGNAAAIPTGSSADGEGPIQGWATVTDEQSKQPAEGAAA